MTASTKEMRQDRGNVIREQNNIGKCEDVLRMIEDSRILLTYIEEVYRGNEERFDILCNILKEMEHMGKEEITCEIYQYGSMIKGDDLLARQLFLWLLGMSETIAV